MYTTEPFIDAGIFDLGLFWSSQMSVLPVYFSIWLAEMGCAKLASVNVEVLFSGTEPYLYYIALSRPATPQMRLLLLALHLQVRLTYPKLEEMATADMKLYGNKSRDPDNESDGSSGTGGLKEENREDGEGGL